MKEFEITELETRLRSWAPRRPSEKISRRLFSRDQTPQRPLALRWGWMAPATAVLLFGLLLLNQHGSRPSSTTGSPAPIVAMLMSNQSVLAYLPTSPFSEQDRLLGQTLEWTNARGSTSSITSLSTPRGTN